MTDALDTARKAAAAFQEFLDPSYWEEYGVSDDDALKGMIAALGSIGVLTPKEAESAYWDIKKREETEALECQRQHEAHLASRTPEEKEMDDLLESSSRMSQDLVRHAVLSMLGMDDTQEGNSSRLGT